MIERIDPARCNQCGLCLEICPNDVFGFDAATGRHVIAWPDDCETCFDCELECPRDAIVVGPMRRPRVQAW
jgi:NAD-dependent dihydropyrimidine dehydrogenase PreA subunit